MQTTSGQNLFVRGYHHHLTFENGFRVYGWTPNKISRKQAIDSLLTIANAGAEDFVEGILIVPYDRTMIKNYWITKKY